ncbi:hypothetical protein TNCV_180561 [Trichonephila clavipes]|nr:hypothetical protein TNCV_180561 [Trichonephila clavipes]
MNKKQPKTVRMQTTIKKVKSLILKENPLAQKFYASKLGMFSGTQNMLKPIFDEEIPALYGKDIDKVELPMDQVSCHMSADYLAKKESETE